jgi:hypothetical protein
MNVKCLVLGHWWRRRHYDNNPVVCKNCGKQVDTEVFQEPDLEKTAKRSYSFLLAVIVSFVMASCVIV